MLLHDTYCSCHSILSYSFCFLKFWLQNVHLVSLLPELWPTQNRGAGMRQRSEWPNSQVLGKGESLDHQGKSFSPSPCHSLPLILLVFCLWTIMQPVLEPNLAGETLQTHLLHGNLVYFFLSFCIIIFVFNPLSIDPSWNISPLTAITLSSLVCHSVPEPKLSWQQYTLTGLMTYCCISAFILGVQ